MRSVRGPAAKYPKRVSSVAPSRRASSRGMAGRRRRRIVGWGALLVVVLAVLVAIVVFGRLDGPTAAEREVGEALALASREVNEFHPAPGAGAVERPAIEDADLYRCGRSDSGWEPRAEVFYSGTDRPELVSELRSFLEVRAGCPPRKVSVQGPMLGRRRSARTRCPSSSWPQTIPTDQRVGPTRSSISAGLCVVTPEPRSAPSRNG